MRTTQDPLTQIRGGAGRLLGSHVEQGRKLDQFRDLVVARSTRGQVVFYLIELFWLEPSKDEASKGRSQTRAITHLVTPSSSQARRKARNAQ
jgi:hypothetical protein